MNQGYPVMTIFGITIRIHSSWIIIFLLITWNLAAGLFRFTSRTFFSIIFLSLFGSILFFASIVFHELAHSLVAKKRGMEVKRITLFLFGGVSNIEREPSSPFNEFIIAIVGPLSSIVLGIIFLLIGGSMMGNLQVLSSPLQLQTVLFANPFVTLFLWLGSINILLALFNL
ncbi:MAG TPA: M50 family metallopeptidase, partial [Patescibacteria group bacterium]|nr:M50 family metallopeptidase [Patescibacteria group bacterium]